jgi:putative acetyltransferase
VTVDNPLTRESLALLERHLAFARGVTPPGHVHALDPSALTAPEITFFGARRFGRLLGIGALKMLDGTHAELKSMHTLEEARGSGVGGAIVARAVRVAAERNVSRVSLETGTYRAFEPARQLYAGFGFVECPPFGAYSDNPFSVCMTLEVDGRRSARVDRALPEVDREAVRRFWERGRPNSEVPMPQSEFFGDSVRMASELATLVVHGPKRATASDYASYAREGISVPEEGGLWIVLDGVANPCALLETTEVRIGSLQSVDDAFAWDEAEGDRTRDWWLDAHSRFFERDLPSGETFDPNMEVVFERFEVRHAEQP